MSEHEEFRSLPYINDSLVKKDIINNNSRNYEELQYLNLIQNILDNGFLEEGRNGKTQSIFGGSMRFSLKNGKIPILTTKKVAWKTCLKELLWFIRGETDNKILQRENVHIWDGNASKEFMKKCWIGALPRRYIRHDLWISMEAFQCPI